MISLLALLKRIEWAIVDYYDCSHCPDCKSWSNNGHTDDCELAAAIVELEKQEAEAVRAALEILGEKPKA